MGKKNDSYTASYKFKAISSAEQFGNRAAQREFGILESNVFLAVNSCGAATNGS
jgi:hypothetical protein